MSKGKMTLEEFQQILKDADVSSDFESILNKFVGYYYRLSDECVADGHEILAKDYMKKEKQFSMYLTCADTMTRINKKGETKDETNN